MDNSVIAPEATIIIERMKSVTEIGGDIERFQRKFAERISGQSIVEGGIMIAFELVAHDLIHQPGATPFLYGMLAYDFDDYILAIFAEHPDFAQTCIEWRNQVIKDAQS
jgi:hypothetical protein